MVDDLGQFPSLDPKTGKLRKKHVPIPDGVVSSDALEKFESQIDLIDGVFWAGSGPPSATWIKAVRESGKTPLDLKQVRKGDRLENPKVNASYNLLFDIVTFDPLTGAPSVTTVDSGYVRGPQGKSIYQTAVDLGFIGNEVDYEKSIHGRDGSNVLPTDVAIKQSLDVNLPEIVLRPSGGDDQPQISSAVANAAMTGRSVKLTAGVFRWDTAGTPWTVGVKVSGTGRDQTIIQMGPSVAHGIRWEGTKTQVLGLNPFLSGEQNARSVTTVSNLSTILSPGDNISIVNDKSFAAREYYNIGEWNVVKGASASTLTLQWPLRHSYLSATNNRIFKYNLISGVELSDLTIRGNPGTWRQVAVRATYLNAPIFRNLGVSGEKLDSGLRIAECRDAVATNIRAINIMDLANPEVDVWTGYGIHTVGSLNTTISELTAIKNRHAFDDSSFTGIQPSLGTKVVNSVAYDCPSAGFSTHGGSDECFFDNCNATNCGGGFILRGRGGKGRSIVVNGCIPAGTTNEYTLAGGNSQNYLHGLYMGESMQGGTENPGGTNVDWEFTSLTMTNLGAATYPIFSRWASLVNTRIVAKDLVSDCNIMMYFRGPSATDVVIENSRITNLVGGGVFIFAPETPADGATQTDVRIVRNIINGYAAAVFDIRGNGVSGGRSARGIVISENVIKGKAGSYTTDSTVFYIGPRYFSSADGSVQIRDNLVRESSSASVNTSTANGSTGLGTSITRKGNAFWGGYDAAP